MIQPNIIQQPVTENSQTFSQNEGANRNFVYISPQERSVQSEPFNPPFDGMLPQPAVIEDQLLRKRPTAPSLLFVTKENQTYSLPVQKVNVLTELHVATGFVRLEIIFCNTTKSNMDAMFVLPTKGTVTSCEVSLNNSRFIDTTFISKQEEQVLAKKNRNRKQKKQEEVRAFIIPQTKLWNKLLNECFF